MVVGELAHERDVVIIGGGPGGYNAAIRAAQLGLSVTLIEKDQLGGRCLNKGCIPSKVFTHASIKNAELKHLDELGISFSDSSFQLGKLQNYKAKVINHLRKGVESLCKAHKIEILKGKASFLSNDRIGVEANDSFEVYRFQHAVIATGGNLIPPKHIQIDHERILNAQSIFSIETIPKHLIVYGSDYIALEIAMSFNTFGSQVSFILDDEKEEFSFDSSINREIQRVMKKSKIKIYKNRKIIQATSTLENVTVELETNEGNRETLEGSHFFVSCKTKANIDELGIERLPINLTNKGFIEINQVGQTSIQNIYAIGDVTEGDALAVKAIKQGKVVAETIAGIDSEIDLTFIPTIVHSVPPIASVGLTEEEARKEYESINIGQFPLASNGYASILGQKDGFIKVISDAKNDLILGVHIIGAGAVELISSGVIGLENVARDEDIMFPLYPHPSINEGLLEAIEALKEKAIHKPPQKGTKVNLKSK